MGNIFNPPQGASFDAKGAMIDTPPVETTPVEPAATENAPVVNTAAEIKTSTPETTPATAEPDWAALLAEKTGGKVKSWEELAGRLEDKPIEFTNDDSRKIFDFLKEGKVDDVLQVYNEQRRLSSIKDMTDEDVVKLAMEYKQDSLSTADIQDEYLSKYSIEKPEAPSQDDFVDEEDFNKADKVYQKELKAYEKELKTLNRRLKQEAGESRTFLESLKKDIVLPDINPRDHSGESDPAEEEKARQVHEALRQEYLSSLDKSSNEFSEISFKVSDEGVNFEGKFQIDESERAQLKKDLSERNVPMDVFLSRYIKGDDYDTKSLMEDIYFLNNKEKIIASIVKQARSNGVLESIKRTKNVDLDGGHRDNFEPSLEVQQREMAKTFFKAG